VQNPIQIDIEHEIVVDQDDALAAGPRQ